MEGRDPSSETSTPAQDRAPAASASSEANRASPRETMWTVGELLAWTQQRFDEVGIETPRRDAEHLLAHALECSRMSLYVRHDEVVPDDAKARFRGYVRRRLAREPVAYIEGKRGFHALGLELMVDGRVLVPRPETEHLVDWLLEELRAPPAPPQWVLDVGTGSGAIALAVKHARPDVDVVACDESEDALAVAEHNARALELDVKLVHSDLLAAVATPTGGWTAVAANLPYIRSDVVTTLAPEVQRFEPHRALDGGPDGLVLIRRLLDALAQPGVLSKRGAVYLEVGFDQAEVVAQLLCERGFADVQTRTDYDGLQRVVRGLSAGS